MGSRALAAAVAALPGVAPGCAGQLDAYPHATLFVDTDLPVPALASHLRVDVFDASGRWRATRTFAIRDPHDLPASFSVLDARDVRSVALVRLRLHPDGAERDYRGERYRPPPADDAPAESVVVVPPGDGEPRLVDDQGDHTPPTEPLPELTVDRLVRVTLGTGEGARIRVALRGACMGRMASLAQEASCVDEGRLWDEARRGDGVEQGQPSRAGTLARAADAAADFRGRGAAADAVVVRGGAFVLGGDDLVVNASTGALAPSSPPRLAVVSTFAIDRSEVTVGRMRAALARGLRLPHDLYSNPQPLGTSSSDALASCTYSSDPNASDPERELLPMNCISFVNARAFCLFEGGDLPTEAQWEYAASWSGRANKTRYPWGEAAPTCGGVVFGRFDAGGGDASCHAQGFPFGLRGAGRAEMDATPDGIRGFAGAVYEWVRGAPLAYDSACFARAGLTDPLCTTGDIVGVVRGGAFHAGPGELLTTSRWKVPTNGGTPIGGLRCAYAP